MPARATGLGRKKELWYTALEARADAAKCALPKRSTESAAHRMAVLLILPGACLKASTQQAS
jgi:hypothetical protein